MTPAEPSCLPSRFASSGRQLLRRAAIAGLCGLVLIATGHVSETGVAADQRVLLSSTEYPPYAGIQLPDLGGLSEIIVKAYQRVGYDVTIRFYPWARALKIAQDGGCDGVMPLWHRVEREAWFAFSAPLPGNAVGFYRRAADNIRFSSLADLQPYRIGTVRGYAYPPHFEAVRFQQRQEVTEDLQNLKKLIAHRIDLAVIDKALAAYLLRTNLYDHRDALTWIDPPLENIPLYIGFSRNAADFQRKLDDFNRGYRLLEADGSVTQIRLKHGM